MYVKMKKENRIKNIYLTIAVLGFLISFFMPSLLAIITLSIALVVDILAWKKVKNLTTYINVYVAQNNLSKKSWHKFVFFSISPTPFKVLSNSIDEDDFKVKIKEFYNKI